MAFSQFEFLALLFSVEFFQDAREVVDVRLATRDDGSYRGYGHVEFATEEAAAKVSSFGVFGAFFLRFLKHLALYHSF